MSDVDTSYFPVDELPQGDGFENRDAGAAGGVAQPDLGADVVTPEMSLPFIGYTFKRFEKSYS